MERQSSKQQNQSLKNHQQQQHHGPREARQEGPGARQKRSEVRLGTCQAHPQGAGGTRARQSLRKTRDTRPQISLNRLKSRLKERRSLDRQQAIPRKTGLAKPALLGQTLKQPRDAQGGVEKDRPPLKAEKRWQRPTQASGIETADYTKVPS